MTVAVEAQLLAVVLADVRVVPVDAGVGERDARRVAAADGHELLGLVRAVVAVVQPQPVPVDGGLQVALVLDVDDDLRALGRRAASGRGWSRCRRASAPSRRRCAWSPARCAARSGHRRRARRPGWRTRRAGRRCRAGTHLPAWSCLSSCWFRERDGAQWLANRGSERPRVHWLPLRGWIGRIGRPRGDPRADESDEQGPGRPRLDGATTLASLNG